MSAGPATALEIAGLHRAFGAARVLDGVDLVVGAGQLVAILGASGGGKTTLLRLVCGFERADAGRIAIGGVAVDAPSGSGGGRLHVRPERRGIGYVAQDGALFPHLTVAANILFGLPRSERRGAAASRRAEALLALVGLPAGYAARLPQTLSGGEQQRVALARALAPGPRLVLLDEPFSALDAGLRAGTRRAVADALRESGAAALLVTHDQAEALSMGDAVGVLRGGRLAQLATPETLYRRPVDAALAGFVGEAVLLDGRAGGGEVSCALGRLPLLDGPGAGPNTRSGTGSGIGLGTGLGTGPDAGPGIGPDTGPGTGPRDRPGAGSGTGSGIGLGTGLVTGPDAGPGIGPDTGPGDRPGAGPGTGPGTGPGDDSGAGLADRADNGPVQVMIRPEQLLLDEGGVPARVEAVSYYGHDAGVLLRLADGAAAQARIEGAAALALRPGDQVGVRVRGPVMAFPRREGAQLDDANRDGAGPDGADRPPEPRPGPASAPASTSARASPV